MSSSSSSIRYTLNTIPPSKLLHYISQQHLKSFLGPERFEELSNLITSSTQKFSIKRLKEHLSADNQFISRLRSSSLGATAFERYVESVGRLQNPTFKARAAQARTLLTPARRGFQGCVLAKIDPRELRGCVHNFNDPRYSRIKGVPTKALKARLQELQGGTPDLGGALQYLPRGLYRYIREHPEEFEEYIEERKEELKDLQTLRRNAIRSVLVQASATAPATTLSPARASPLSPSSPSSSSSSSSSSYSARTNPPERRMTRAATAAAVAAKQKTRRRRKKKGW